MEFIENRKNGLVDTLGTKGIQNSKMQNFENSAVFSKVLKQLGTF